MGVHEGAGSPPFSAAFRFTCHMWRVRLLLWLVVWMSCVPWRGEGWQERRGEAWGEVPP